MGEFFLAITIIVAIVRGLYRFFRWAGRSLKGLSTPAGITNPPAPMSAPTPSSAPNVERGRPAPMTRPSASNTLPPPVVSREATTSDFRDQETRLSAAEPRPVNALSADENIATPNPAPSLFGGTPDLVRALILQEVLGPPLSKRRPPAE